MATSVSGASVWATDHSAPADVARFDLRPMLVFWETTRACDLACRHCRADAQHERDAGELTTDEARVLIDELATVKRPRPVLILTGGDCLQRDDLFEILDYAALRSVPVALSPSVTPRLSDDMIDQVMARGVRSFSLSLDGSSEIVHDGIRGVDGHFDATLAAIDRLRRHGARVQINTTVMSTNVEQLAEIAGLLAAHDVNVWEVFFLVVTGRAASHLATTPAQNEDVCNFLVDASRYGFAVRTVEAPFFRRIAKERASGAQPVSRAEGLYDRLAWGLAGTLGPTRTTARTPSVMTRDGQGIVFVSSLGEVFASGFLPLSIGNVREGGLLAPYRDHPLTRAIRASEFDGACGTCSSRALCGGSRARAYAGFADPLASDPACPFVPLELAGVAGA